MEVCNARYDMGVLTERFTWLTAKLEGLRPGDREREFVMARIDIVNAQLDAIRANLSKLYKEMYDDRDPV